MWVTAFVMGIAGSLHCLGMCSPLAMAVTNLRKPYFLNRLLYNSGRIFTYGLLGAVVGAFGSLFKFSGFQTVLSISLGVILLIVGITGISRLRVPLISGVIQRIAIGIKSLFSTFVQRKTVFSITILGALNGLLPCGLTYLALTYCLTVDGSLNGFLFMILFGAGTIPMMLGITSVVHVLITKLNISFQRFTTVALIVLGSLLIARSLLVHSHHDPTPQSDESIVVCR